MIIIRGKGYLHKNIFGKCEEVLKKLEDERIMSVEYHEDLGEFHVYEKCDEYFSVKLTKEDCENMARLFSKMASMYQ